MLGFISATVLLVSAIRKAIQHPIHSQSPATITTTTTNSSLASFNKEAKDARDELVVVVIVGGDWLFKATHTYGHYSQLRLHFLLIIQTT